MPTYEYACRRCGEHLEVVQSFRDDPLTECPRCQGELRKVFSAAGIIFKGSGWHIKDYGGSSASGGSGGSSSSSSESGAESPAKSDAAPAAKSESTATSESKSA